MPHPLSDPIHLKSLGCKQKHEATHEPKADRAQALSAFLLLAAATAADNYLPTAFAFAFAFAFAVCGLRSAVWILGHPAYLVDNPEFTVLCSQATLLATLPWRSCVVLVCINRKNEKTWPNTLRRTKGQAIAYLRANFSSLPFAGLLISFC